MDGTSSEEPLTRATRLWLASVGKEELWCVLELDPKQKEVIIR